MTPRTPEAAEVLLEPLAVQVLMLSTVAVGVATVTLAVAAGMAAVLSLVLVRGAAEPMTLEPLVVAEASGERIPQAVEARLEPAAAQAAMVKTMRLAVAMVQVAVLAPLVAAQEAREESAVRPEVAAAAAEPLRVGLAAQAEMGVLESLGFGRIR